MRSARQLEAVSKAIAILQSADQRKARGELYAIDAAQRRPADAPYASAADDVASTWNAVAFLVRSQLIPEALFLSTWGSMAVRSYEACRPWIEYRRTDENNAGLWSAFHEVAVSAGYIDPQ
jgi:flagellar biosynthesis regulator FlaF